MQKNQMKQSKQTVKIICPSCGGEFEDVLPKCPFCETLNVKGAEAEYMKKLEDVREDMAELGEAPEEETKKALRSQGKFLGVIFGVFGVIVLALVLLFAWDNREEERDAQGEYLWKQENFPKMDEMYENGQYDQLREFYIESLISEKPVGAWDKAWFCEALENLHVMERFWELEQSGEELLGSDYTTMLYYGWHFKSGKATQFLTEEQVERIAPRIEQALEKFENFWQFDEETRAEFEKAIAENDGHISYEYCQKYVKEWREDAE